jgi:hypothetical protein
MKTIRKWVLLTALAFSAFGCMPVSGGNGGALGIVYAGYKMGGNIGTGTGGAKSGTACAKSILGIVAIGDASLEAATKAGGITSITDVDHDVFNVLGVYGKTCTIVRGD